MMCLCECSGMLSVFIQRLLYSFPARTLFKKNFTSLFLICSNRISSHKQFLSAHKHHTISSTMNFLALPSDVTCLVLAEWCTMVDITKFDTACCNTTMRVELSALYSAHNFQFSSTVKRSREMLWIALKTIKINDVVISGGRLCTDFLAQLSRQYLTNVSLLLYHGQGEILANIINTCVDWMRVWNLG